MRSLLCGLMLGCTPFPRTTVPTGPPGVVELVVEIDPRIDEAADLVTWVDEEGRKILAEMVPNPARNGVVQVTIEGTLYDYEVTMTPLRGQQVVGAPAAWTCECTNEELLKRVRVELSGMADRLVARDATSRR